MRSAHRPPAAARPHQEAVETRLAQRLQHCRTDRGILEARVRNNEAGRHMLTGSDVATATSRCRMVNVRSDVCRYRLSSESGRDARGSARWAGQPRTGNRRRAAPWRRWWRPACGSRGWGPLGSATRTPARVPHSAASTHTQHAREAVAASPHTCTKGSSFLPRKSKVPSVLSARPSS